MAIVNINTIKNWFKTGMIPTQDQFWSVFDSFRHKGDKVPVADVEGINELLATRASQQVLDNHLAQKGAPNGYAPLDEFTKLAAQYLNIVNDLVTGGATALLSAEQGKVLQGQISAINTLLTSDNVNLDTVQELVDAIETVQLSLSTILVNDLATGGTTKALTAEMGKQLDLIKESTANKSTSIVVDYLSNIKFPSVKAVYDFCMSAFKKKFLAFGDVAGITHTFGAGSENTMFKFSNNNPITATIPTNSTTPFEIGTVFETIAIGNGALTVTGAPGVTILTNLSNTSVKNEVRRYTKIDTDTWSVEGNIQVSGAKTPYTVFIDTVNGSDISGQLEDSTKPFKTANGAFLKLPPYDGVLWTLNYIDSSNNRQLPKIPVRDIRITSNNTGKFNFTDVSSNLTDGRIFEIIAPLSELIITNLTGQCSMRPSVYLNLVLSKISCYCYHNTADGFFGFENPSSTVDNGFIKCDIMYLECPYGFRPFGLKGDVIVRKFINKTQALQLVDNNVFSPRLSFYEIQALTYDLNLTRTNSDNFIFETSKYSGDAPITEYNALVVDFSKIEVTCPNLVFDRFKSVTGVNKSANVSLRFTHPNGVLVEGYYGIFPSLGEISCGTLTISNSYLSINGTLGSFFGHVNQSLQTLRLNNVNVNQTNTSYLFHFQNASGGLLRVDKSGYFKTNASTWVAPNTAAGTGINLTDLTPNSL